MSGSLTFNGVTAESLGLRIGAVRVYDAPGREVQTYMVPGRIGAIYPTKDLSQIPNQLREYTAALYLKSASDEEVERALASLRAWLMIDGYAELTDSYEPNFYRRAFFSGDFLPERRGAGPDFVAPLTFSCDPRRYIRNVPTLTVRGQVTITTPETVQGYHITEASKPLIFISNGGDQIIITFSDPETGDQIGKVVTDPEDVDYWFDSETLIAYYPDGTYANDRIRDVSGDIRLGPGQTNVSLNSALCELTIHPRWWVR